MNCRISVAQQMDGNKKATLDSALDRQKNWLKSYEFDIRVVEQGNVVSVGDGITWIKGLPSAAMDDVLEFEDGSTAVVFTLSEKLIGAVLLQQSDKLTAGTAVCLSGKQLNIPVGNGLLGRVIDPLGNALDGREPIQYHVRQSLDVLSPTITKRDFIHEPLLTGNKIIDTLIPVGKGQRQLIIGDKSLGRSAIAIDTVINQRGKNINCVYVLIGQKRSSIVNVLQLLKNYHAMEYTTVVVGEASALPGLKYLAPFAGCAIAEHWMEQGRDTLIVYDDLSTHAKTYRELSLLLRRPPGREAYPGDMFFLHARLLERSTCLSASHGGGSMTALPIVETKQGEIAAYIPTNLISITDGQIYLDATLFENGFHPAIDIGKSVSRIGGKAQHKCIKEEAAIMKLEYLQFLELEVFTRFGARLETSMQEKIKRGRILREILKQDRLKPLPIEFQYAWLIAFNEGLFDKLALTDIKQTLEQLLISNLFVHLTLDDERDKWLNDLRALSLQWSQDSQNVQALVDE